MVDILGPCRVSPCSNELFQPEVYFTKVLGYWDFRNGLTQIKAEETKRSEWKWEELKVKDMKGNEMRWIDHVWKWKEMIGHVWKWTWKGSRWQFRRTHHKHLERFNRLIYLQLYQSLWWHGSPFIYYPFTICFSTPFSMQWHLLCQVGEISEDSI